MKQEKRRWEVHVRAHGEVAFRANEEGCVGVWRRKSVGADVHAGGDVDGDAEWLFDVW